MTNTNTSENVITKKDFNELKSIVKKIVLAQKELVSAQQRTEWCMEAIVNAQKEITTIQQRTEQQIEELAMIQQRTDIRFQQLIVEHDFDTRKQLVEFAMTVGYRLEDFAYKTLPLLLERDFDITVQGKLKRAYLIDNQGEELEIKITGKALKEGKEVTIIGESKTKLSKNHINTFIHKHLKRFDGLFQEVFPVLVTYMTNSGDVETYAKTQGIAVYYSYDFNDELLMVNGEL